MYKAFPFFKQHDEMDCGPTCLRMIAKFYGRSFSIHRLRNLCQITKSGVNLLGIHEAAQKVGIDSSAVEIDISELKRLSLPSILVWQKRHFVVIYRITNSGFHIADPANGKYIVSESNLTESWIMHNDSSKGIALILSPTLQFKNYISDKSVFDLKFIFNYLNQYRFFFAQLILGLALGTSLTLVAPFLTQLMVDQGINYKNFDIVYLILIAQIFLFIGTTSINFIRSWLLYYLGARINISVLSSFVLKLMKLPISFFETKTTGDVMQRFSDQQKIENFLTGTALNAIFSVFSLIAYTWILFYYNKSIFIVSLLGSVIYAIWIYSFLKKRKVLNYKQFANFSNNQTTLIDMIGGIQDIKLSNSEKQKFRDWENVQAMLFETKAENLKLDQYQQGGGMLISQFKNILITFLSVQAVINNQITLGGMMAIQFIVGQISGPIEQMLQFVQSYQDAKISVERLTEIYSLQDEERPDATTVHRLPDNKSITLKNIIFRYPGAGNDPILEKLTLHIPGGKTTAIVGLSGSGKTSILKLLLRFFVPESGNIFIGDTDLKNISLETWRRTCGAVMQDGTIFSDTIANNITLGDEIVSEQQLNKAIDIANLTEFINSQTLGSVTKIGRGGNGLSQGQKQRILIARAVYKNPDYLFFDEATNSLDAANESIIMQNLQKFFIGKTVLIVAHRLSAIRNAENIIVLEGGKIIEQGTHDDLVNRNGKYHQLVNKQMM